MKQAAPSSVSIPDPSLQLVSEEKKRQKSSLVNYAIRAIFISVVSNTLFWLCYLKEPFDFKSVFSNHKVPTLQAEISRYAAFLQIAVVIHVILKLFVSTAIEGLGSVISSEVVQESLNFSRYRLHSIFFWLAIHVLGEHCFVRSVSVPIRQSAASTGVQAVIDTTEGFLEYIRSLLRCPHACTRFTINSILSCVVILVVQKILLYILAYYFSKQNVESRVKASFEMFKIIDGMRKRYHGDQVQMLRRGVSKLEAEKIFFDRVLELSGEISAAIFNGIRTEILSTSNILRLPDVRQVLPEADAVAFFQKCDLNSNGELTQEEITAVVQNAYNEQLEIVKFRRDSTAMVLQLDDLLAILDRFLMAYAIYMCFGLDKLASGFTVFASTAAALLVMKTVEGTMSDVFNSVVLIFFYRPFDIGDKIIWNGKTYTVERIQLLTTVLIEDDGASVLVRNSMLSDTLCIANVRRSDDQYETATLVLSTDTTQEKLNSLEAKVAEFLVENSKDFYPDCKLGAITVYAKDDMRVSVTVRHRGNFSNSSRFSRRSAAFNRKLYEALTEEKISLGSKSSY